MNWFQRHLNWAVVLAVVAGNGISYAFGHSLGAMYPDAPSFSWGPALFIPFIIILPVVGWALKQKSRSLGWLFVPGQWIIVLCLQNRNLDAEAAPQKPEVVEEPQSWGKRTTEAGIKGYSDADSQIDDTLKSRQKLMGEADNTIHTELLPARSNETQKAEKTEVNFCPGCGNRLAEGMAYCPNCSRKIRD